MTFHLDKQRYKISSAFVRFVKVIVCSLTISCSWTTLAPSAFAAQELTLKLGPFEQTITLSDLEQFARTGKLSDELQIYAPLLTKQVQELLTTRLQLEANAADKVIEDLLRSPTGKQLINVLEVAIPEVTIPQLQAALTVAARQANGLSVIDVLRAYPQENITVDASNAIALLLQFNPNYVRSSALGTLLEEDVVNTTPVKLAFDPAAPGTQTVQQQTRFFQEQQRNRTIPVDLYWGANSQKAPLIVIVHGFGANRKFLAYLARHLASHGLVVAALEHPGGKINSEVSALRNPNELLRPREFIDRPQDVSFALDQLARLNQQPGVLQGKLNTQQVSVIGHSLGGYTALALAGAEVDLAQLRQVCQGGYTLEKAPGDWLQCAAAALPERKLQLRDRRIKSAIALNPLIGQLFGKTGLNRVETPVLVLAGTEDAITPAINHQFQPFTQLKRPKYLLTAVGGTHLSISDATNTGITTRNLVKERRGEETKSLRQLVQGVSLAFIKQLTPEAKIYQPFLTSAYAQSLSTSKLPLRLSTDLPANISPWVQMREK